jgi:uncharacterized protein (TIGR02147 family)
MDRQKPVSIYDYTDYRQFLRDYYAEQKAKNPAFSYRYFAKRAGFNSSGLYKDIVDGRTGITRGLILRFAGAMKFQRRQEEYFETLVYFNEAKTVDEKNLYFERLMKHRDSKAFRVDAAHYEYYSKWYYIAVRELLAVGNFRDDYSRIARSLNPGIRLDEARKAIAVLLKLGLIAPDEDGYYRATKRILTTGTDVTSLVIANFQKAMMELARQAIDRHPVEHRNITTVTFSVSQETCDDIKAELDACRKRILGMIERSENETMVCQLNFQLFPLTRLKETNNA